MFGVIRHAKVLTGRWEEISFFDGPVELGTGRSSSLIRPRMIGSARNTAQETTMPQPIPYLAFDGNCADAMRFYAKVLEGKLDMLTFGQSPMSEQTPKDALNRIMHARLALQGNGSLYAGDCPPGMPYQGIHGVSIALNYDAVALAERVFKALAADGGKVTMPFGPTFWAKGFGMVTDKFGCPWLVNGEMIDVQMSSPGV
ncbi:MAG: VOC family protein [Steroidobacteraceae bacterium]